MQLREADEKYLRWVFSLMAVIYFFTMLHPLTNNLIFLKLSYAAMFVVSIGCLPFFLSNSGRNRLVVVLIFYLVVMVVIGLFRQNWSSYIFFDLKNFFFLLILFIPFNKRTLVYLLNRLPNLMAGLLLIGLPVSWYFILAMGLQPAGVGERLSADLDSVKFDFVYSYKFVDFSVLLLPFINVIKGFRKIVVILSALTFLLVSFFTLTRGATFVCVIGFISMFYMMMHSKKSTDGLKILLFVTIMAFLVIQVYNLNKLNSTYSSLLFRLNDKENFTTFRADEQSDFFNFSTIDEILLGRGMGGSHFFGIWSGSMGASLTHGMNMTHFGYLYLILKGGVILLVIIYGMALHAMVKLWKYGGTYQAYSIVIILYLFYEISITKFYDPFYLFLLLMAIYVARNLPGYSSQNKLLLQQNLGQPAA